MSENSSFHQRDRKDHISDTKSDKIVYLDLQRPESFISYNKFEYYSQKINGINNSSSENVSQKTTTSASNFLGNPVLEDISESLAYDHQNNSQKEQLIVSSALIWSKIKEMVEKKPLVPEEQNENGFDYEDEKNDHNQNILKEKSNPIFLTESNLHPSLSSSQENSQMIVLQDKKEVSSEKDSLVEQSNNTKAGSISSCHSGMEIKMDMTSLQNVGNNIQKMEQQNKTDEEEEEEEQKCAQIMCKQERQVSSQRKNKNYRLELIPCDAIFEESFVENRQKRKRDQTRKKVKKNPSQERKQSSPSNLSTTPETVYSESPRWSSSSQKSSKNTVNPLKNAYGLIAERVASNIEDWYKNFQTEKIVHFVDESMRNIDISEFIDYVDGFYGHITTILNGKNTQKKNYGKKKTMIYIEKNSKYGSLFRKIIINFLNPGNADLKEYILKLSKREKQNGSTLKAVLEDPKRLEYLSNQFRAKCKRKDIYLSNKLV